MATSPHCTIFGYLLPLGTLPTILTLVTTDMTRHRPTPEMPIEAAGPSLIIRQLIDKRSKREEEESEKTRLEELKLRLRQILQAKGYKEEENVA